MQQPRGADVSPEGGQPDHPEGGQAQGRQVKGIVGYMYTQFDEPKNGKQFLCHSMNRKTQCWK